MFLYPSCQTPFERKTLGASPTPLYTHRPPYLLLHTRPTGSNNRGTYLYPCCGHLLSTIMLLSIDQVSLQLPL